MFWTNPEMCRIFFSLTGSCSLIRTFKRKRKTACPLRWTPPLRPHRNAGKGSPLSSFALSHIALISHLVVTIGNYILKISIQHKYYNCSRGNNNDSIYLFESSTNWYNTWQNNHYYYSNTVSKLVLLCTWISTMSVKSVWTVNNLQHTCYIYRYLTFICIYINRLCPCLPYKRSLYTKFHALNCTCVRAHLIYRCRPHWRRQVELRRQHGNSHSLKHASKRAHTHT